MEKYYLSANHIQLPLYNKGPWEDYFNLNDQPSEGRISSTYLFLTRNVLEEVLLTRSTFIPTPLAFDSIKRPREAEDGHRLEVQSLDLPKTACGQGGSSECLIVLRHQDKV